METKTKKTVYFLDDENFILILAQKMLEVRGYAVMTFNSAKEFLDTLLSSPADVVVIDYMMPGVDGEQMVSRIRGKNELANLPIIIYSAADPVILDDLIKRMKLVGYIPKGIKMTEFVDRMERLLGWPKQT